MSQFLSYTLNVRLSKNITRGHVAQRREHRSAIGMADDVHSVTIKPNLSPVRSLIFKDPRRIRQVLGRSKTYILQTMAL